MAAEEVALEDSIGAQKQLFYTKLEEFYLEKPLRKPPTREKVQTVIQEILDAKQKQWVYLSFLFYLCDNAGFLIAFH